MRSSSPSWPLRRGLSSSLDARTCLELLRGELLGQPAKDALRRDGVTVLVQGIAQELGRHGVWLIRPVVSLVRASSSRHDVVRGEGSGAELKTGEVSLTDGPGGHDESQLAGREAALVRVCGDGGIEQCRGLDGVLMREVGADEVGSVRGDRRRRRDPVCHELVVVAEGHQQVEVPLGERGEGLGQGVLDVRLGHGHEAVDDRVGTGDPLARQFVAWEEGARDDAAGVGAKEYRAASDNVRVASHGVGRSRRPARSLLERSRMAC